MYRNIQWSSYTYYTVRSYRTPHLLPHSTLQASTRSRVFKHQQLRPRLRHLGPHQPHSNMEKLIRNFSYPHPYTLSQSTKTIYFRFKIAIIAQIKTYLRLLGLCTVFIGRHLNAQSFAIWRASAAASRRTNGIKETSSRCTPALVDYIWTSKNIPYFGYNFVIFNVNNIVFKLFSVFNV